MPSGFVEHHTRAIPTLNPTAFHFDSRYSDTNSDLLALQSILVSLNSQPSSASLRRSIDDLRQVDVDSTFSATKSEKSALRAAAIGKLTVALYAEVLDLCLSQALELEAESEWWGELERSPLKTLYYLLQSLPLRVATVAQTVLTRIHAQNVPIRLSLLHPSAILQLFPSPNNLRPNALTIAMFPHLEHQCGFNPSPALSSRWKRSRLPSFLDSVTAYILSPFELTRHECQSKRKDLEKLRDDRAEVLGNLIDLRGPLTKTLAGEETLEHLPVLLGILDEITTLATSNSYDPASMNERNIADSLSHFANETIPRHAVLHTTQLKELGRPSRLVLVWPRLLFLPPVMLYCVRMLYISRVSLLEAVKDTKDTVRIFFRSWVLEPLRDIIKTVRAGRDHGMLISSEGIQAESASLIRMTLSLAKDKLNMGSEEMNLLSERIRLGDLTPILELYEEDIKTPVKSALTGSLLRSVFIQVQKAKVDIDHALAGIDNLLKSQELTFAFVGVAPALSIVYVFGGIMKTALLGGKRKERYGGRRQRTAAWYAMRRVERLLLTQPSLESSKRKSTLSAASTCGLRTTNDSILPLTAGLLLLSVTRLRKYAEKHLPLHSRIRDGFLEDVEDLEDPSLSRDDKIRVIDRMWRSWGRTLGWDLSD